MASFLTSFDLFGGYSESGDQRRTGVVFRGEKKKSLEAQECEFLVRKMVTGVITLNWLHPFPSQMLSLPTSQMMM